MSFNILGNGLTGLQASQQALNVISQNIANATTPGYVRQRAILESQQTAPGTNVYTGNSAQFMGVAVTGVERISSAFKQAALNTAVGKQEALAAQAAPLDNVQGLLQEPSDVGLQRVMTDFYQNWTDLGNAPTVSGPSGGVPVINGAAAGVVMQQGATLAANLNSLSQGVSSEYSNQFANLNGIADQVNAATDKIATLNQQIMQGTASGNNINALLDQRDSAVTEIVRLTGATTTNLSNGSVQVAVSGVTLVSGNFANTMTVVGAPFIQDVANNPPGLMIGTVRANPAGGEAAGVLSAMTVDLPRISDTLDIVANGVRDAVNAVHSTGYTIDGTPGGDFFTGEGAQGLTVAVTSPEDLAVSSIPGTSKDGSNALRLGELVNPNRISEVLGGAQAPQSVYTGMVSQIGTQLQGLNTAVESQNGVVSTAQAAVDSESGVDLNEELTNMILFQRSFQANSRVIATANEMLQSLIGMV